MPYAFNLTLDPVASLEIERIYAALAALGVADHDLVTQYGPCVTILVVADRVDPHTILDILKWKLPGLAALRVTFTEPCIIEAKPPVLSLRAAPSDGLLALHDALYTELPEEEVHLHHRPAYWQPHLKLANLPGERSAAERLVARLASDWRALDATIDGLEVMRYPPVQSIWQAPLRSG